MLCSKGVGSGAVMVRISAAMHARRLASGPARQPGQSGSNAGIVDWMKVLATAVGGLYLGFGYLVVA
jgi:hypothetical protein